MANLTYEIRTENEKTLIKVATLTWRLDWYKTNRSTRKVCIALVRRTAVTHQDVLHIDNDADRRRFAKAVARKVDDRKKAQDRICHIISRHLDALAEILREALKESIVVRPNQSLVRHCLPDAPVSEEHLVPPGWSLSEEGIELVHIVETGFSSAEDKAIICPAPIVVSGMSHDLDSGFQRLEIAFKRMAEWHVINEPRATFADKRSLPSLANYGLPVTTFNASALIRWLSEYEHYNLNQLSVRYGVSSCGWKRLKGSPVFVIGKRVIGLNARAEVSPVEDISQLGASLPENLLDFLPEGPGDERLVAALSREGSLEQWLDIIPRVVNKVLVMVGVYAGLVPCLAYILDSPNFLFDFWGPSSVGKTAVAELAASVWGLPTPERGGIVRSWDSTKVFIESYAALLNHIPICLDDSHLATPQVVSRSLYQIANGVGRGRGAPHGLRQSKSWQTVGISTGEQPVTSVTKAAGARARVVSFWGTPFGQNQGELVRWIKAVAGSNYGHIGPLFISFLLQQQDKWDIFRELYRRRVAELAAVEPGGVADRYASYFAALSVAGVLFHHAFRLQGDPVAIVDDAFTQAVKGVPEADYAAASLRYILSWARGNEGSFRGRHDEYQPPREFYGAWTDDYLAIYPHKLEQVLQMGGFSNDGVKHHWGDRGWIQADGRNLTYPVRIQGEQARMVKLLWDRLPDVG